MPPFSGGHDGLGMHVLDRARRDEIQATTLRDLARVGEPRFDKPWYPYTSGEVGPYYLQSISIEKDGAAYARAVDHLVEYIEAVVGRMGFDAVSGGESRDWDFSAPVAVRCGKPHIKLYKDRSFLGASPEGKRIVHVADLNNEGASMKHSWVPALRERGGEISHAFFFVDRLEAGVDVLARLGIERWSLVEFDEQAWHRLREIGHITADTERSMLARAEDRHAWAERALREHADYLRDLLTDSRPDMRRRARAILNQGYPHLKDELLEAVGMADEDVSETFYE